MGTRIIQCSCLAMLGGSGDLVSITLTLASPSTFIPFKAYLLIPVRRACSGGVVTRSGFQGLDHIEGRRFAVQGRETEFEHLGRQDLCETPAWIILTLATGKRTVRMHYEGLGFKSFEVHL